jgi:hypothetical protein
MTETQRKTTDRRLNDEGRVAWTSEARCCFAASPCQNQPGGNGFSERHDRLRNAYGGYRHDLLPRPVRSPRLLRARWAA